MPIGYGYKESGDAGYVNWAAVTKGFTDVLDADIKDKKKREEEYETQDRELSKTLADQPLGQFEDGNTFTNNAVDMITKQKLIDHKLWRAGRLSDKQYRLKQNNMVDNISTLFDLQKTYQAESEKRMKGLQDQSLQPLTANNMAMIEGFKDFKDSVPMVDPETNIVSIVKKVYDKKTNTWNIDKTKSMPVKMAMNLIMKPADAFKVNEAIDQDVARMGTLKDSLSKAATIYGAGSVEELVGPEGFTKYPGAKGIIENYNKAINQTVDAYLKPGLNLTSVLTMQVGGYSAESFTYDKAEAAKDPSKILMKIDPNSKYPTIDETGPSYKKQKEEAASWIKTQFMSRIDREKKITTTSQLSDQTHYPSEWETAWAKDKDKTAQTGEMLAALYGGNDQQVSAAKSYFLGLDGVKDVERDATGTTIYYKDGTKKKLDFTANKVGIGVDNFVDAGTKALLGNDVSLSDARRGITKYKGNSLNTKQVFAKPAVTSSFTPAVQKRVADNQGKIVKDDNTSDNINRLTAAYGDLGFRFTRPEGNPKGMVILVSPTGKIKQTVNVFGDNPENAINQFIINQQNDEFSRKIFAPTEDVNAAAIEGGGIGSQYNNIK